MSLLGRRDCWIMLGLIALIALGMAPAAKAWTGITHETPLNSLSGLRLRMETQWVEGFGYRPVAVTLTAKTPAKRDRLVTLRVYASDWSFSFRQAYNRHQMAVEQDFVLPAGQITVAKELLIPQLTEWQFLWWDAWIDGRKDPDLSIAEEQALSHTSKQEGYLCLLRVHPTDKIPPIQTQVGITQHPSLSGISADYYQASLPTSDLKYTAVDAVLVKADQLGPMLEESPEGKAALLRWVHAGGTLWIDHLGDGFEDLADATTALSLEEVRTPDQRIGRPDQALPQWRWVALRPRGSSQQTDSPNGRQSPRGLEQRRNTLQREVRGWYAELPLGLGRILAFPKAWYQPPDNQEGETVRAGKADLSRCLWTRRHGMDPSKGSRDFTNFLPPKVGVAPVVEFQVLMTLFALCVGPVSYWIFRNRQQRHLMIMTTPLLAIALTVGLVSYSIISDGFATYLRVRSLTVIDQRTNHASSWSRMSYYAGIAPDAKMEFGDSTAVYPIASAARAAGSGRTARRLLEWLPTDSPSGETMQSFKEGWLPTRETTQFLQVRSFVENDQQLTIRSRDDDQLEIENGLGSALSWAVVCDQQGRYWQGRSLEVEQSASLEGVPQAEVLKTLTQWISTNRPAYPTGWSSDQERSLSARPPSRRRGNTSLRLANNLMNLRLESLIDPLNEGALPRGSYLAITTTPTHVDLGLNEVELVEGFHVVLGSW